MLVILHCICKKCNFLDFTPQIYVVPEAFEIWLPLIDSVAHSSQKLSAFLGGGGGIWVFAGM